AFGSSGLVPDGGSALLGPARVGFARAAEMAMLGERVGARRALEWGLINQVWPDGELAARAAELLIRLADGPTRSYAGTKRQLNSWLYQRMEEQLELEAQIQQEMAASGDFAEGVRAFAGKRQPRFSGVCPGRPSSRRGPRRARAGSPAVSGRSSRTPPASPGWPSR